MSIIILRETTELLPYLARDDESASADGHFDDILLESGEYLLTEADYFLTL